jgi:NADH-quinone oxidoreductase subunit H
MSADNSAAVPLWVTVISIGIFFVKVLFFLFFFMWIRWTLPRFRYDQLMSLGWKFMLPLALAYIVIIASLILALDYAGVRRGFGYALVFLGVNAVLVVLTFLVLDRGRIISPAYGRASPRQVAALRAMAVERSQLTPETGD